MQIDRFLSNGWEAADALDMIRVYGSLPQNDVARIEKLEFLDEKELLEQLLLHYCISWGTKDSLHLGLSEIMFWHTEKWTQSWYSYHTDFRLAN